MENIGPHSLGRPAHEAVVEGFARPVDRRRIDPTASGLQNMNDSADHPAVVHPELATRVCGKKRLKPGKLRLCQPKMVVIHLSSPFEDRESQNRR